LQALLTAQMRPGASGSAVVDSAPAVTTLPLAAIRAGQAQPRRSILPQPLEELAASIRSQGVIQPIVVRRLAAAAGAVGYEIVAGERRWQAAQLAGLTEIPVIIRDLSDQEAVAIALIENIQREELTPAEEARSLQRLIGEFQLTHQEVAEAVGRSRAAVSNLLRLLDLPGEVLALIDAKSLAMGHARALLGLPGDAERVALARWVVQRGLSVRATEASVRKATRARPTPAAAPDASSAASEREVLRTQALRVQLERTAAGKLRMIIELHDASLQDQLLAAIRALAGDH
jgi:ParB family chromosome partitioning protein